MESPPIEEEPVSWLSEVVYICRGHIILVAMAAQVVFGWLMSGRYLWALTGAVAIDWFFINLLNRVTDVAEDARNGIPGTELVRKNIVAISVTCVVLLIASFFVSHYYAPDLTKWRLIVLAIGLAYNFRILPSPKGLTRLKELYFFKNFGSAVIFVFTCFLYPRALLGDGFLMTEATFYVLIVFFVCFEMTYEIAYDLRDIVGDTQEGVPTYPVVHGATVAQRINQALLIGATAALLYGFFGQHLGARELLMLAAPLLHWWLLGKWGAGISKANCILLTHLGTGLLLFYLLGTYVWLRAGLPSNVYFG